ncbi:MAG: insecticidal delta-endotoxin Cry8Ea1 family protein [Bacillus thuringiensis]|nr:insecticidal delta-endotoxin Cry8Ea1 family protein [Bacillus thuringiensis]
MNSNRKNENEIINALSIPAVSNHSAQMDLSPDARIEDSLCVAEGNNIDPFVSASTVQTGISIAGRILGVLGVPFAGQLASFYSFLVGELWPSGRDPWEIFMEHVEQIVRQQITDSVRDTAIARLEGLGRGYRSYQQALETWLDNRNDARSRSIIRERYIALELDITTAIPLFSIRNQEVPLLMVYAQAANLHLLLLRDASLFGSEWGMSSADVNQYYQEQIRYTEEYSNHCVQWYNTGLNRLRGTTAESWVRYNQFRRDLTLGVLDLVALFPSYDTRTYPIPTTAQLTREVYTDPNGVVAGPNNSWFRNGASFSAIENAIIRQPHLYDFLTNLTIYTRRSQVGTTIMNLWAGHRITFNRIQGGSTSEMVYGAITNPVSVSDIPFVNRDVYRTVSLAGGLGSLSGIRYGLTRVDFDMIFRNHPDIVTGLFYHPGHAGIATQVKDSETELPPETTEQPNYRAFSHLLSHISMGPTTQDVPPVYSWTHQSADRTNTINSDRITQIPLVKAHTLQSGTTVVKGPGFTGGDILRRTSGGPFAFSNVNLDFNLSQRYRARIRYASTTNLRIYVTVAGERIFAGQFDKTMDAGAPLTFQSFSYATINTAFTFPERSSSLTVGADTFSSGNEVYVDRFELIPVTATFEAESDLERARKAVNALFTSTNPRGLKTDVTDYHIDQVSNLVECLSDEFCLDKKRELLEEVKYAKRLSDERNLLQDPTFTSISGQTDRGWIGSTGISIQGGDDIFKENYVTLPGTVDECYPTYLYQKIDESQLKSYTRYQLRGYIEDSQDLEIYLIRYNAKHETLSVPGTESPWPSSGVYPIGKCGEPNRCAPRIEWNPDLDCSCRYGEKCVHHSHHFSLDIDVGCTDLNEDLGVWVIFKIKTQDGHAKLGNLEFIEEKPLLGKALSRVKRAEKKWRDKYEKLQLETKRVYTEAKESVDALFVDSQYDKLQANTNIGIIHGADKQVHRIREAYLSELPVIPSINAAIFEELEGHIFKAYSLYDARNVIKNGDFNNGLSCWNVKGHVDVQQNHHRSVLVLSEWEAEVSQKVRVCPDRGYILRVTAYKEGYGEGCVTIHEFEDNTDVLKFRNFVEEEVYPNNTVTCNDYTTNQSAEGCTDACNSYNRGYEDGYENRYENNPSAPVNYTPTYEEGMYTDTQGYNHCVSDRGYRNHTPLPAGYVTLELEYFPETEQVWIEIGETEGTFIVGSVELLLMEE